MSDPNIGCIKEINYRYNIIAYADNLVLLGPSSLSLQELLNRLGDMLLKLAMSKISYRKD